jgi:6-phosphogluconolactonase
MRLFAYFALAAGLAVLAVPGAVAAPASAAGSDVVGQLYVNNNTAVVNTVSGFDRRADGTLTPLPGSPFATGGAGTGHGIGSQGALQLSADGRYLLAVDAGSNDVSVLRIKPDGQLTPAQGSPVASGGHDPVSIAVHDRLVYVANAGDGGSNYTGFTLNAGGQLRPLAGSTVDVPDGSGLGDVLFNGDGTRLVGVRVNTSLIDSFTISSAGLPTAAAGSPFAAQGAGPFGSEFRPTNAAQLYVSNAHDGALAGTVSAFSDAANGTLTPIGASPYADHQTAPCWVEISHDGNYLFAVNTASNSISRYEIADDGSLALLGGTALSTPSAGAEDARLAPDGETLWIVGTGAHSISGFAVDAGGNLAELASSPTLLPVGTSPFGIVVT